MGASMASAWAHSFHVAHVDILDPSDIPAPLRGNEKISPFKIPSEFVACAHDWDILVLAVKPQIMDEVLADLATYLPRDLTILSIAAGKPLDFYKEKLGEQRPIIRAMPNTPASIGKGMSVAIATQSSTPISKDNAHFLLSCLGKTEWIADEILMDAVTAVSGSGPAYVFYLMESLAQAGVRSGLEPDFAMTLARQTVIGAAALADDESGTKAAQLRENVTSPGGTTAAALSVLMDGRFQALMDEAVAHATKRGKDLSR